MDLLEFVFGTVFGLVLGISTTAISLNHTNDADARKTVLGMIDEVIELFHEHYGSSGGTEITQSRLDYRMKSLFGNSMMLSILGREVFEGNYSDGLSELFSLSSILPRELTADEIAERISAVHEQGVLLKRIVNINSGHFRLFRKR